MKTNQYLTAQHAANQLGVSLSTLYAYVSRGLIRSEALGGRTRERLYSAEDVRALQQRKAHRRNPAKAAAEALYWGSPVLDSAISLIRNGALYYRGHDVAGLADLPLERVTALLWVDDLDGAARLGLAGHLAARDRARLQALRLGGPAGPARGMADLHAALLCTAGGEPDPTPTSSDTADRRRDLALGQAARALNALLWVAGVRDSGGSEPVVQTLARAWGCPGAAPCLNAALVLCADHELNVSAFAARCVASAQAPVYAALQAGLCALQGLRHGGHTQRVAELFGEVRSPARAPAALAAWLRRGEGLPGFGHTLYPDGDPRAVLLLDRLRLVYERKPAFKLSARIAAEVEALTGDRPTIDFALAALTRTLDLPDTAALLLFALGRSVGWVAHILEQGASDALIRPRARYTGRMPEAVSGRGA